MSLFRQNDISKKHTNTREPRLIIHVVNGNVFRRKTYAPFLRLRHKSGLLDPRQLTNFFLLFDLISRESESQALIGNTHREIGRMIL